jgi:hypothetical protein
MRLKEASSFGLWRWHAQIAIANWALLYQCRHEAGDVNVESRVREKESGCVSSAVWFENTAGVYTWNKRRKNAESPKLFFCVAPGYRTIPHEKKLSADSFTTWK